MSIQESTTRKQKKDCYLQMWDAGQWDAQHLLGLERLGPVVGSLLRAEPGKIHENG